MRGHGRSKTLTHRRRLLMTSALKVTGYRNCRSESLNDVRRTSMRPAPCSESHGLESKTVYDQRGLKIVLRSDWCGFRIEIHQSAFADCPRGHSAVPNAIALCIKASVLIGVLCRAATRLFMLQATVNCRAPMLTIMRGCKRNPSWQRIISCHGHSCVARCYARQVAIDNPSAPGSHDRVPCRHRLSSSNLRCRGPAVFVRPVGSRLRTVLASLPWPCLWRIRTAKPKMVSPWHPRLKKAMALFARQTDLA